MRQCTYQTKSAITTNFFVSLSAAESKLQSSVNCELRTANQWRCGLLTNCGFGHLLRTAQPTAADCELRTTACPPRNPQCVAPSSPIRSFPQFVVSQQSVMPLVRN